MDEFFYLGACSVVTHRQRYLSLYTVALVRASLFHNEQKMERMLSYSTKFEPPKIGSNALNRCLFSPEY